MDQCECCQTPNFLCVTLHVYRVSLHPYAPNACEAASLKMALSVKGIATKTSLKTIINWMPKAKTPTKGFVGNPYTESRPGETRTIYPAPLTKYAKTYDQLATNITGASKAQLIREVKRGNAVVFAGAWRMQQQRVHVLALVGYKHGKFLVAVLRRRLAQQVYWTSTRNFMRFTTLGIHVQLLSVKQFAGAFVSRNHFDINVFIL